MKTLHKSLLGLVLLMQLFGNLAASEKEISVFARDRAETPARKKTSKKGKNKAAAASKHTTSHRVSKIHSVEAKRTLDDELTPAALSLVIAPSPSKKEQYTAMLLQICSEPETLKEFIRTGHTLTKHAGKKPAALRARALREKGRADKFVTSYTDRETALQTIADTMFTRLDEIADFLASRTTEGSQAFCCKHTTGIGYGHDGERQENNLDESRVIIAGNGKNRFFCSLPSSYPIVSSSDMTEEEIVILAKPSPIKLTKTTPPAIAAAGADTDTSSDDSTPRITLSHKKGSSFAALLSSDSE